MTRSGHLRSFEVGEIALLFLLKLMVPSRILGQEPWFSRVFPRGSSRIPGQNPRFHVFFQGVHRGFKDFGQESSRKWIGNRSGMAQEWIGNMSRMGLECAANGSGIGLEWGWNGSGES